MSGFIVDPIGCVHQREGEAFIELYPEYRPGLLGSEKFSHINIYYWLHKRDNERDRKVLQVIPPRPKASLTGVFACRSPSRPNSIGHFVAKIIEVREDGIAIERIDAFEGTPVLDIKPYIISSDCRPEAKVADWLL